jgi:hypothetical protein
VVREEAGVNCGRVVLLGGFEFSEAVAVVAGFSRVFESCDFGVELVEAYALRELPKQLFQAPFGLFRLLSQKIQTLAETVFLREKSFVGLFADLRILCLVDFKEFLELSFFDVSVELSENLLEFVRLVNGLFDVFFEIELNFCRVSLCRDFF